MKRVVMLWCCAGLACASLSASERKWGVGVRLGSLSGAVASYRLEPFDLVAGTNVGLVHEWFAVEGGVDKTLMHFDWTEGDWTWSGGLTMDLGYRYDDDEDGFFVGLFAPQRLNYTFPKAPWKLFVELGPGVDIVPDVAFDLSCGIGAQYLF